MKSAENHRAEFRRAARLGAPALPGGPQEAAPGWLRTTGSRPGGGHQPRRPYRQAAGRELGRQPRWPHRQAQGQAGVSRGWMRRSEPAGRRGGRIGRPKARRALAAGGCAGPSRPAVEAAASAGPRPGGRQPRVDGQVRAGRPPRRPHRQVQGQPGGQPRGMGRSSWQAARAGRPLELAGRRGGGPSEVAIGRSKAGRAVSRVGWASPSQPGNRGGPHQQVQGRPAVNVWTSADPRLSAPSERTMRGHHAHPTPEDPRATPHQGPAGTGPILDATRQTATDVNYRTGWAQFVSLRSPGW
ncbi:hypothetical protein DFJ67_6752 [Asanoa ferruginea]|uniref:Uncharacterized protein n=1 Tax=Asanoa ferruginea TaxID=53367 RepID=A0A3D9ZU39_9ACTN|nr:hypothetical protein DFJ67_6752 [Asanoa ferruginea]